MVKLIPALTLITRRVLRVNHGDDATPRVSTPADGVSGEHDDAHGADASHARRQRRKEILD